MAITTQALQIEIADYLFANNGPDDKGRGHPKKKRLMCSDLERAIELVEARGLEKGFKPYHIKGTFHVWTEENINEVLTKKLDQLLAEKYNGDFFRLVTETNGNELLSDLIDKLNRREIKVSMNRIGKHFKESPFDMLQRYININDIKGFENLKPYHLAKSSHKIFDNPKIVDEVLVKKIDQLLAEKYDGDFFRLVTETNSYELLSDLIDKLNGREIKVSMSQPGHKLKDNVFNMLHKYIKIKRIKDFENLKQYHLAQSSMRTFTNNPKIVDEVLVKKIDQLLAEKYDGDFFRLVTETNQDELLLPFIDKLNGRDIEVSMRRIVVKFNGSPFKMLQKYASLTKRPFKYSKECFFGLPETKKRRIAGDLSRYDLKQLERGISKFGFRQFNSEDKDVVREFITETYMERLGETTVSYLGLESHEFHSLKWIANELNYDSKSSAVIERDDRVYNAMVAQKEKATNGLKITLEDITLINGDFDEEVKTIEGKFNLVNFDTCGHYSNDKVESLRTMFERELFAEDALLYITLDNSGLAQHRAKKAGFEDQIASVNQAVNRFSKGYTVTPAFELDYKGTNNRPMVVLAYQIKKAA